MVLVIVVVVVVGVGVGVGSLVGEGRTYREAIFKTKKKNEK